jgi:hypothetical protein
MSAYAELANAAATVERLDPSTGAWAAVAGGSNLTAILDTRPNRQQPAGTGPGYMADDYHGQETDILILDGITPEIHANDRITVTPTGGSARKYRARRPKVYNGILPHQEIPLADYAPGAA